MSDIELVTNAPDYMVCCALCVRPEDTGAIVDVVIGKTPDRTWTYGYALLASHVALSEAQALVTLHNAYMELDCEIMIEIGRGKRNRHNHHAQVVRIQDKEIVT